MIESIHVLSEAGVKVGFHWLTDCALVTRARNELVAHYMASGMDYALFIDSDVSWEPTAPLKLLAHDLPFVAAATSARGNKAVCIRNFDWSSNDFDYDPAAGLLRVESVGFAFVMLRRDGILAMERAYPNLKLEDGRVQGAARQHLYAFFAQILERGHLAGEDYSFCSRWRAIGGEVMVDPTIQLWHFGEEKLGGRLADSMQLPLRPPAIQEAAE